MKIIVVAPSYDQNSGGSVCMHELAWTLKLLGIEVYIASMISTSPNCLISIYQRIKSIFFKARTKKESTVDVISYWNALKHSKEDAIYIYPEVVLGNPYRAKKIVRWLLHRPMYFNKSLNWNYGDVVVRYDSVIDKIIIPDIVCLNSLLRIVAYPLNLYKNKNNIDKKGVAYSVRKGKITRLIGEESICCLLYTSPSPRDYAASRMPSSA